MECRRVARFIRDAAERIVGKDDAVTGIDRVHDRREDVDIVLGARYAQQVSFKSIPRFSRSGGAQRMKTARIRRASAKLVRR